MWAEVKYVISKTCLRRQQTCPPLVPSPLTGKRHDGGAITRVESSSHPLRTTFALDYSRAGLLCKAEMNLYDREATVIWWHLLMYFGWYTENLNIVEIVSYLISPTWSSAPLPPKPFQNGNMSTCHFLII